MTNGDVNVETLGLYRYSWRKKAEGEDRYGAQVYGYVAAPTLGIAAAYAATQVGNSESSLDVEPSGTVAVVKPL